MRKVGGPLVPREFHVAPDADDPPDLEFYASWPFTYAGRYFLNVLTYCGSFLPNGLPPMRPTATGRAPWATSWWVSDDGLTWERPFRGQDVGTSILAGPIQAAGKLLFYIRDQVWGVPEDRLTNVSAAPTACSRRAPSRSRTGRCGSTCSCPAGASATTTTSRT